MKDTIVSVILLTYNHEAFIRECLESVINQKTDFNIEVIIGEDCSTDGTFEICEKFEKKYPNKIKLLRRNKNLGLSQNLIETLSKARGKYIVFQEGDDYWTCKYKLQKQANILLYNTEIIAVTHNSNEIGLKQEIPIIKYPKQSYSLKSTSYGRIFHTNSWMIRRENLPNFSLYFENLICWDILMELKIFEKGKVYYIDEILSIWRRHDGGNSIKIPIRIQLVNFENLYKTLIKEGNFVSHYRHTIKNIYKIYALEIAKMENKLFFYSIAKYVIWQFKTLAFDFKFFPRLLIILFSTKNKI